MKRTMILAALMLTLLSGWAAAQSMGTVVVSWDDAVDEQTHGPADNFVIWRSVHPDTGFAEYAGTEDTMYVDTAVPNDQRVYYRISSVRGYLLSPLSDWVSLRWLDYTDGRFDTERLHRYYPGDPRVLLIVWPPNETCAIVAWEYGIMDAIGILCTDSPFTGPAMNIQ